MRWNGFNEWDEEEQLFTAAFFDQANLKWFE